VWVTPGGEEGDHFLRSGEEVAVTCAEPPEAEELGEGNAVSG